MSQGSFDDIFRLPVAERMEIAEALWNSIIDSPEAATVLELTTEQRAELHRRLEEHERDPSSAVPWEEVRRKLLAGK